MRAGKTQEMLKKALGFALQQQTVLIITPTPQRKRELFNELCKLEMPYFMIRDSVNTEVRGDHPHKGQIRFFDVDHVEWDPQQKRVRSYPHHVPTLIDPGEEL